MLYNQFVKLYCVFKAVAKDDSVTMNAKSWTPIPEDFSCNEKKICATQIMWHLIIIPFMNSNRDLKKSHELQKFEKKLNLFTPRKIREKKSLQAFHWKILNFLFSSCF